MNMINLKTKQWIFLGMIVFLVVPAVALAHQPRLTESRQTVVTDPEISKAYYGKLMGQPDTYIINASVPFALYVNILVPDIAGQKKDLSAEIFKNGASIAKLDETNFAWKQFYEPFGVDNYWMGPEYKAQAEAGDYEIRVTSPENDSKYSLAIGEAEAFDFKESMNALKLIPILKRNFFNESPLNFILSPFGWGLIVVMYLLAAIFGFIYRLLMKRLAKGTARGAGRNIGSADRWLRALIGAGLLLWAITTSWSPILIFFSGFCFFEALFSWCGLYAALGKNTCPL